MLAPLVAGFLIGYVLDREGRKVVCVCPPGETPPPGFTPISPPDGGVPPGLMPVDPNVVAGLEVELVQLTERDIQPYGTSATYYLDKLLDARFADKVTFLVDSSCNQALTVQTVGGPSNTPKEPATLVNIEASQSLAAGNTAVSRLSLGIDLDINWHFFLGVTIASGGTPPTTGGVSVLAQIRRRR